MKLQVIVYDLDGTLLETLPDLHASLNHALAALDQPRVDEAAVRRAIGDGAKELVSRLLPPQERQDLADQAYSLFKQHYLEHCADSTVPLPGAMEFLTDRRSEPFPVFQALLSNKEHPSTDLLVRRMGLEGLLDFWLGSEGGFPRKPHPAGLLHVLERAGATASTALMIGDSRTDIDVARAVGMRVVALTSGYGNLHEIMERDPDWMFPDMRALRDAWPLV